MVDASADRWSAIAQKVTVASLSPPKSPLMPSLRKGLSPHHASNLERELGKEVEGTGVLEEQLLVWVWEFEEEGI